MTRGLLFSFKPAATCPNLPFCHSRSPSPSSNFLNISHRVPRSSQTLALSPKPFSISLHHVRPVASSSSSSSSSTMAASSTQLPDDQKPFAVLFVCLGNICRSPAAEAVFTDLVHKKELESHFKIDSCGTIGYHEGNPADARMRAASKRRGIEVTSISRSLRPTDFKEFDLILAMDKQNREDILSAYERWGFKESLPADAQKKMTRMMKGKERMTGKGIAAHSSSIWVLEERELFEICFLRSLKKIILKVKLMCSYCKKHKETEVPDPYYGGPQGFEKVLDMLEDACGELLDNILVENSHITAS